MGYNTLMNKINIREFAGNIYRYLKQLPVVVTVHGKPRYVVERVEDEDE